MKVMLSLNDETVAMLDLIAERSRTTRSGMVAALAASEYKRIREDRHTAMLALLGDGGSYDGRGTEHVAEDRRR